MRGYARTKFDKRKYPLRKVIERDILDEFDGVNGKYLNLLECGHKVPPAKDFYGEIFSVKQRCKYCYNEKIK